MNAATVALIVQIDPKEKNPVLVETLSDEREVAVFTHALDGGDQDPLQTLHVRREQQAKEDEEFGNYVEDLLSRPFVRPEIQEHGVQWLKSKIRIEEFKKSELEAASIIAEYAFKLFREDRERQDFYLAGPTNKVRIRIFVLSTEKGRSAGSASNAA